jgi:hypothetical protein
MSTQHQEQEDPEPGLPRPAAEQEDLERASVPELLVMLAETEDAIRKAARAGHPPTASMTKREDAIVEALRRRHGLAFHTIGEPGRPAVREPATGGGTP